MAHNTVDQGGKSYVDHQSGALCKIVWCKSSFSLESSFQYIKANSFRTWKNSKLCELLCELAVEWTTLMSRSVRQENAHMVTYTPLCFMMIYTPVSKIYNIHSSYPLHKFLSIITVYIPPLHNDRDIPHS